MKVFLSLLALATLAAASKGGEREALQEDFGYVEVRTGAHMFWVMYHVDQPGDYTEYPLIMWLQGGPGSSGVGYGNFMELGPYDINGNLREYAWTKKANVMFVDNPVGTGYSYVEDSSQFTTDNSMIADDLVALIKSVFTTYPDMQVMPFYVFAESYGGKMTVDFALAFDQAIKNGEVVSDFRGVALGDSWISPMDSVNTWGTFLYQMGFVNQNGQQAIDDAAASTQAAVDAGEWETATNRWSYTEYVVLANAHNVNFYNVLATEDIYRKKKEASDKELSYMSPDIRRLYENHVGYQTRDALGDFMNGAQAESWGIPDGVVWDSQGGQVFNTLAGDFMKPVVDSVVSLLTETTLDVVVFTGDLDLICDTPGTYRWIENMEWADKPNFMAAENEPIYITEYSSQAATIQKSGRFSLYTIFRSGHMVPIDAPELSHKMLDMIFANSKKEKTQAEAPKKEEPVGAKAAEETPKAVKQEEQPKQEHPVPLPVKLADLEEEAFKEEVKKEKEAAKQKEETKGEEHEKKEPQKQKEVKHEKKQTAPKKEEVHKKQTKVEHKKEMKKQQQKAPKAEKVKEKVAKQVKQKMEKVVNKEQKQKAPKHEKGAPKQETHKQEVKKGGPLKDVNKYKAKVMAARQQQQQQQRGQKHRHGPGPLPADARRMKR